LAPAKTKTRKEESKQNKHLSFGFNLMFQRPTQKLFLFFYYSGLG